MRTLPARFCVSGTAPREWIENTYKWQNAWLNVIGEMKRNLKSVKQSSSSPIISPKIPKKIYYEWTTKLWICHEHSLDSTSSIMSRRSMPFRMFFSVFQLLLPGSLCSHKQSTVSIGEKLATRCALSSISRISLTVNPRRSAARFQLFSECSVMSRARQISVLFSKFERTPKCLEGEVGCVDKANTSLLHFRLVGNHFQLFCSRIGFQRFWVFLLIFGQQSIWQQFKYRKW